MSTAVDVITEYREQKQKLERLATAARKQMQAKYLNLLMDAATLQREFKSAFGATPDLPGSVRTFALCDDGKPAATDAVATGKKIGGLRRSLNAAIKNNDSGKAIELTRQLEALGVVLPPYPPTEHPSAPQDVDLAPAATV
jgi:hypothetical protein